MNRTGYSRSFHFLSELYLSLMLITKAALADAPAIVELVNRAYRGDASRKGWTTEADIIGGEIRILQPQLEELMRQPGAVFLLARSENGELAGSVYLHPEGENLYLGMLSVDPGIQAQGTGKQLMQAAEDHARKRGCRRIYMRVIHLRKELIAWYERRGYHDSGTTADYKPNNWEEIRRPFHFIIMEKTIIP